MAINWEKSKENAIKQDLANTAALKSDFAKTKTATKTATTPTTSSMPLVSLTGPSGKDGEKILSPQELANIGKTTTPKVSLNDIYY